ncbi:MAG: L-threonylcarbamoyladenylate synthase [Desulfovibrio sp.]|jgi:L-threonylcarbamoyladenylate synthase|nr:L-threonylcarbamoyladenylate synthase [Desulfovibrio sp.]
MKALPLLSLVNAAQALIHGELLIFPTETVFGLGGDSMNAGAVEAVFRVKRRPLHKPLPVVSGSRAQLVDAIQPPTETEARLMELFWPGPLSIVCRARAEFPPALSAGSGRVAARVSPHPAVRALCRESGLVLVATSANISENPSARRLEELDGRLIEGVAGVFYLPPDPAGGKPSTLVEVVRAEEEAAYAGGGSLFKAAEGSELNFPRGRPRLRILRRGAITEEKLLAAGFTIIA